MFSYRQLEYARRCGTIIHELAATLINNGLKINDSCDILLYNECMKNGIPKEQIDVNRYLATLIPYVNDAIHYKMRTEQLLYYNSKCFGTADAIVFEDGLLRVHDLKTGLTPAHMEQLYLYAALFCLEYDINVNQLDFELRIYQNEAIAIEKPDVSVILPYVDAIVTRCQWLHEYDIHEEVIYD